MRLCGIVLVSLLVMGCAGTPTQQRDVRIDRKTPAASSERPAARLALVIGNGGYAQGRLANAVNDARDMKAALSGLGFTVQEHEDADLGKMEQAIREFGDQLGQQQGVGLFYYAGHATQVEGRNYLLPIGARIEREDEIRAQSVELELVLRKMKTADNRTNIVILDACRNNPFRSFQRSGAQGLAQVQAPSGTIIAYATAPGSVASDEGGRNGLYTAHLLQALKTPGLPIEMLFKQVRQRVLEASGNRQEPWESTSLRGDFYFVAPVAPRVECPEGSHLEGKRCVMNVRMECPAGMEFVPGEGCAPRVLTAPVAATLLATKQRPTMVLIPGGTFWMGSPPDEPGRFDSEPRHRVEISRGFWLAETEVTQVQYTAVSGKNPSGFKGTGDASVEKVSWFDAVVYCNKLSDQEGLERCYEVDGEAVQWNKQLGCGGYRLPTEAEWEYAARGGREEEIYSGSNDAAQVGWFGENSRRRTHRVKGKKPNDWGLYDMSGNVWEWVWDGLVLWKSDPVKDPIGKVDGPSPQLRVVRGGSWGLGAQYQRVAFRAGVAPTGRNADLGFRPARSLP